MTEMERLTIRVPRDLMDEMEDIVNAGEYRNVSQLIRAALEDFVPRASVGGGRAVVINISPGMYPCIEALMINGAMDNIQSVVARCVDTGINTELERIRKRQELTEDVSRATNEYAMRRQDSGRRL